MGVRDRTVRPPCPDEPGGSQYIGARMARREDARFLIGRMRYVDDIRNKRHPNEMGSAAIEAFLTHLAAHQRVAASTQNQALSALCFLYRDGLNRPLDLPIRRHHTSRSAL